MPQTTETMHSGACAPQLERENPHATTREKPVHRREEPGYRNERSRVLQLRPNVAKKKKKKKAGLSICLFYPNEWHHQVAQARKVVSLNPSIQIITKSNELYFSLSTVHLSCLLLMTFPGTRYFRPRLSKVFTLLKSFLTLPSEQPILMLTGSCFFPVLNLQ